MEKVVAELGGVDVLVVNTGGPPKGGIETLTAEQWQEGFQSLWMSAVEGIQAALPGMKERHWGRIVLVTSVAAREAMPRLTISNGLRAGLMGLVKTREQRGGRARHHASTRVLPGYHAHRAAARSSGVPEEKITPADSGAAARASPRSWGRWRRSSPRSRPRTSPASPSSSTAGGCAASDYRREATASTTRGHSFARGSMTLEVLRARQAHSRTGSPSFVARAWYSVLRDSGTMVSSVPCTSTCFTPSGSSAAGEAEPVALGHLRGRAAEERLDDAVPEAQREGALQVHHARERHHAPRE